MSRFQSSRVNTSVKNLSWDSVFGSHKPRERVIRDLSPQSQIARQTSGSRRQVGLTPSNPSQYSTGGYRVGLWQLLEALRSNAPGTWSDDRWEQTRQFVGIAYVGIAARCRQALQAEWKLYKRDTKSPDGRHLIASSEHNTEHPMAQFMSRPNHEDTFGTMMYNWELQLSLTGVALNWVIPDQHGDPIEQYPISTATAVPMPVMMPQYPQGAYRVQAPYPYGPFTSFPSLNTAVGALLPAEWVMRIKYPHPFLRYEGYSPLTAGRLQFDSLNSIDRSRWYAMLRGIDPSAVLNYTDTELTDGINVNEIDRIRGEFEAMFSGPENAGRLLIGTPGGKLEPWSARPLEMGYDESWRQLSEFLLALMGVTKPAANMLDESSYSTLYAAIKQFHLMSLKPDFDLIAGVFNRRICPFFSDSPNRDDLILEINCPRIDDHEVTGQKIDRAIAAQCATKNEVRKELGWPPTKEPWGEEIAGSQPQQEQGAEQGEQKPGGGAPQPPNINKPMAANGQQNVNHRPERDLNRPEPPEVTQTRPRPGKLGRGSLGPRA